MSQNPSVSVDPSLLRRTAFRDCQPRICPITNKLVRHSKIGRSTSETGPPEPTWHERLCCDAGGEVRLIFSTTRHYEEAEFDLTWINARAAGARSDNLRGHGPAVSFAGDAA
jgi:hypothetical protein